MKKRNTFGFTLLELLVVIGIISLLISVGFVSYSTAQKKARDTKIKSDMSAISNALEQYYAICGSQYPANLSGGVVCLAPSQAIMPTVPVNPKSGAAYSYTQVTTADYRLCAPTPPFEAQSDISYCLQNQQ